MTPKITFEAPPIFTKTQYTWVDCPRPLVKCVSQSRAEHLAIALGKWHPSEQGYVMSRDNMKKLKIMWDRGIDANPLTRELIPPKGYRR